MLCYIWAGSHCWRFVKRIKSYGWAWPPMNVWIVDGIAISKQPVARARSTVVPFEILLIFSNAIALARYKCTKPIGWPISIWTKPSSTNHCCGPPTTINTSDPISYLCNWLRMRHSFREKKTDIWSSAVDRMSCCLLCLRFVYLVRISSFVSFSHIEWRCTLCNPQLGL